MWQRQPADRHARRCRARDRGGDGGVGARARRDLPAVVLFSEAVEHDEAAAGGIGPRGHAHVRRIGRGQGRVVVTAREQVGEALREQGRALGRRVEIIEAARLADRRGVIVGGVVREAGVAEVRAAVDNIIVIARAAERDDLPRAGDLLAEHARIHVAVFADPAGPKLGREPGRGADGVGRIARRIAAVVLPGKKHRNLQAVRTRLIDEMVQIGSLVVRAPTRRVLVLELGHDDVAAMVDLVLGDDFLHLVEMAEGILVEIGAAVAQGHAGLRGEPCGQSSVVPLRA